MKCNAKRDLGTLDADLSCNANGAVPAAAKCAVAAGQEIGVEMHQQPGDRTCTTEAIGGNHDGPVIIYMSVASLLSEISRTDLGTIGRKLLILELLSIPRPPAGSRSFKKD